MKKFNFFSRIFKKENRSNKEIPNVSIKVDSRGRLYFVNAITGNESSTFVSKKDLGNGVFRLRRDILGDIFFLDTKTMKQSNYFKSAKKIDGEIYLAKEMTDDIQTYVFFNTAKMKETRWFTYDYLDKLGNGVFILWCSSETLSGDRQTQVSVVDAQKNKESGWINCDDVEKLGNGILLLYLKDRRLYDNKYVSFFDIEKMEQSELIEAVNVKKIKKDFLSKNH